MVFIIYRLFPGKASSFLTLRSGKEFQTTEITDFYFARNPSTECGNHRQIIGGKTRSTGTTLEAASAHAIYPTGVPSPNRA
jgi:hypothetical protein